jgi:hypothetical protein
VLVTRVLGHKTFFEYVDANSSQATGWRSRFGLIYFTPIMMVILLILGIYEEVSAPYSGYSWAAILGIGGGWLLATLLAAFYFTRRPWHHNVPTQAAASL